MRSFIVIAALGLLGCAAQSARIPQSELEDALRLPSALANASLTPDGLGPIRVGGSVDPLREQFGWRLEHPEPNPDNESCGEWAVATAEFGYVSFTTHDGLVSGLSMGGDVGVRTSEGIGIGSTADEVRAAYPNAERRGAEYTPAPGHELFVWSDRENHIGYRFEIGEDERVTAIHAGGDLSNDEGCAGA